PDGRARGGDGRLALLFLDLLLQRANAALDLAPVGGRGHVPQERSVEEQRLRRVRAQPVGLGDVVQQQRIGLGVVGGLELGDGARVLAQVEGLRAFLVVAARLGGLRIVVLPGGRRRLVGGARARRRPHAQPQRDGCRRDQPPRAPRISHRDGRSYRSRSDAANKAGALG